MRGDVRRQPPIGGAPLIQLEALQPSDAIMKLEAAQIQANAVGLLLAIISAAAELHQQIGLPSVNVLCCCLMSQCLCFQMAELLPD
jgi:hypothetical protein